MSNLEMGTVYDLNKQLVKQEKTLSPYKINNEKKKEIAQFIEKNDFYFMLLCHEQRDYTLFRISDAKGYEESIKCAEELIETINNRGEVKGIDLTENKDAIEIWILIDDESFCYYFFPYDNGVVEV